MANKRIFRIMFSSQGKGYELYARKVSQGEMHGFIEVEEIVFGERSNLVVDPSEEALKKEFAGLKRMHIPFHAISRIDEVEKEGPGKVISLSGGDGDSIPAGFIPPGRPAKDS